MTLVDECHEIFREEIDERGRTAPGKPLGEVHGIVLDPVHIPHFLHHLQIILDLGLEPFDFDEIVLRFKELETRIQFKEKGTELEFTTGDASRQAKLTPGRRLMLFGPEGFREAPANHRLVIVMGSNADSYFESIEKVLGAVAAAKREQALTPEERQGDVIKRLLELSEEQGRIQRLKADFDAAAAPRAAASGGATQ